MSSITPASFDSPITMSSREIADLVDSRHDKVKQSIERLAERGVIDLPPMGEHHTETSHGRRHPVQVYHLQKRDSFVVVAHLSPEFTARLVDRWQELEEEHNHRVPDLSDPHVLIELLTEHASRRIEAERRADAAENQLECLASTKGSMCVTEAAKALGRSPKDLFAWLSANGWAYRRDGRGAWMGYQKRCEQGLLEHRVTTITRPDGTSKVTTQMRITAKGLTRLAETITTECNEVGRVG